MTFMTLPSFSANIVYLISKTNKPPEGVPNTFADKLNPTVATSAELDLGFYNVGSWFIFSVTQENVVSATLQGNTNEDIAGTIRVTMDGNSRPVASVQSGAKSITITPQTGDSFVVGELYYMVLIPQTLSGGYTLTLTKADGSTAQYVNSNEAAFVRSQYRRKRNADDGLIYIKTGNIDFADAAVKTIYVPTEECLDTYKNATWWTSYKWKMKWINEFVPTIPVPEAVDLGLPSGLKWASFNVGASAPEEYGDYYAWGDTETRSYYSWSTYKFRTSGDNGQNIKLSKYNTNSSYGTVDNKTVLAPEDDVAQVKLGGGWRMPTFAEWTELWSKCANTWTDNYNGTGVKGIIVTGKNGNSIFLPAAGYRWDTSLDSAGSTGYYWSSSLYTSNPSSAWIADCSSSNNSLSIDYGFGRCFGRSVRPVVQLSGD